MKKWITTALAAFSLSTVSALAQDAWPERAVTIVVPFSAGTGTDVVTRVFAQELEKKFGQPFVVENRPGANGTTASGVVARSEPDGYTLVIGGTTSHAASHSILKNVTYDPVTDFDAVAGLGEYPYFLLVNAKDPYPDLKSLVEGIRKTPGELSYGYGNSLGQLICGILKNRYNLDITAVPYKSSPPAIQDLLGQRITYMFNDLTAALPQVKSGALRILAVSTENRSDLLPEVPTLTEAGMPLFPAAAWSGVFAPKGTPEPIVEKLRTEIGIIAKRDDIRKKLGDMGFETMQDQEKPFIEHVKADVEKWNRLAKDAGITPQ
ncbi:ABC transporter substrate-binding protein [Agaricicola taiwanensis]|uniref:ABC transporter substrate-binding protein n=1 Tax=Agaricicola taiwanensis TaxID=591372 RepID=A0A8J2VQX3_9RHOB|nr:tripartite tricarboxylate transporter substrate binding protein [Agaricicola taiwanensis]GGE37351.1 ABC transporter substrate-binding protein [Agaricicola taiwanensis]